MNQWRIGQFQEGFWTKRPPDLRPIRARISPPQVFVRPVDSETRRSWRAYFVLEQTPNNSNGQNSLQSIEMLKAIEIRKKAGNQKPDRELVI